MKILAGSTAFPLEVVFNGFSPQLLREVVAQRPQAEEALQPRVPVLFMWVIVVLLTLQVRFLLTPTWP